MSDFITIAIPKGRILQDSVALFKKIGINCEELLSDTRKLVFEDPVQKMRYMIVRATDVPTYVEYGCADLGIVGKDTLMEQEKDLYEPLDLKFGYCRLVVAEPAELSRVDDPASWANIRIATKYPNVTEKYFAGKGVQVEIIKLYGSIELATPGGPVGTDRGPGVHRRDAPPERPGRSGHHLRDHLPPDREPGQPQDPTYEDKRDTGRT